MRSRLSGSRMPHAPCWRSRTLSWENLHVCGAWACVLVARRVGRSPLVCACTRGQRGTLRTWLSVWNICQIMGVSTVGAHACVNASDWEHA